MDPLDQALAAAADSSHDAHEPPEVALEGVSASPTDRRSPKKTSGGGRRNVGLLVALLGAIALILGLVFNFRESAVYAKSVDQLLAEAPRWAGRSVRVEGTLVKGSLSRQEKPCEYNFRIANQAAELPVRYANCVVPDTFRDLPGMDVKVTVEGKLTAPGNFEASLVMAKCPSKYEMKERRAAGEEMPHEETVRQTP